MQWMKANRLRKLYASEINSNSFLKVIKVYLTEGIDYYKAGRNYHFFLVRVDTINKIKKLYKENYCKRTATRRYNPVSKERKIELKKKLKSKTYMKKAISEVTNKMYNSLKEVGVV